MLRLTAMIPARLGSKRVKKKNLRLIEDRPLISYIIEAAKKANIFDSIYLNSESEIFSKIAKESGVNFYKRPPEYSTDQSTNDEFGLDFIENVSGDILIQLLPTSPLITSEEIVSFVTMMVEGKYDTLISTEQKQIACVYENSPINFDRYKINPPSQNMSPVQAYATVLMGWKYENFQQNMRKYACAYHGGDGEIGFFELRGLSTLDIDREEDFLLVEQIIKSQNHRIDSEIKYYNAN